MKNLNNIINFFAGLIISTILLYIIFFKNPENWKNIQEVLQTCNYNFIFISIVFGALALISRAIRWKILIKSLGYNTTTTKSSVAVGIGYFSNLIIPRIGEIIRCSSLSRITKIPFDKLFGTIILERIIDLFMMFILTLLILITQKEIFIKFLNLAKKEISELYNQNNILSILVILIILFIIILFIYKKITSKIKTFIQGVKTGILSIKTIENKFSFISHTIFIWFMYVMMTYVCFFAFEATKILDFKNGLYTMVVGGYAMMMPVQGGLGSYHLFVSKGMELLNINTDVGVAFATAVHGAQSLMTILIGLIAILVFIYIKKK